MRDFVALRGLLASVALFLVAMLAVGTAVAQGASRYIVPAPENTTEQSLRALKAHRYSSARDQLTEELRGRETEERLRSLVRELEDRHGGIAQAHGRKGQVNQDSATAAAAVEMGDGSEQHLGFRLRREQGLWKIESLEPLEELR